MTGLCLHTLYNLTSPSAENRKQFVPVGRLLLPSYPLACSLMSAEKLWDGLPVFEK